MTIGPMKTPPRVILILVVVAATIAAGALHGHMTLRWGPRPDMVATAALLENVPSRCGNWRMTSSSSMSDAEIRMLRCAGHLLRRYVNDVSGESVDVSIIFGPPGAISEHTPEVCFSSRNATQIGKRERTRIEYAQGSDNQAPGDELWFADFQSNRSTSQRVRIYWAWSAGDRWVAPDGAKTAFAGSRHLYKIQLSTNMVSGGSTPPDAPNDACGRFLKEFLPAAQRCLVAETPEPVAATDARR
jgi:hypothetical protein